LLRFGLCEESDAATLVLSKEVAVYRIVQRTRGAPGLGGTLFLLLREPDIERSELLQAERDTPL